MKETHWALCELCNGNGCRHCDGTGEHTVTITITN